MNELHLIISNLESDNTTVLKWIGVDSFGRFWFGIWMNVNSVINAGCL